MANKCIILADKKLRLSVQITCCMSCRLFYFTYSRTMHFCSHAKQEFIVNLVVRGYTCMNSVGKTKFHDDYSVMKWKLIANIIYCQMI